MKNFNLSLIVFIAIFSFSCQQTENNVQEEPSPFHDGINWAGENEIANYLAFEGIGHWMNIEREKAYVLFEKSVELDSSQFACHTALSLLSRGEKRDYHTEMAKKYVAGENEVSNLLNFAGNLDEGTEEIEKYLEMYPDGYNALDSRAEFYLIGGDTTNAIEYYKKTVEKFPFAISARNALRRLDKD